MDYFRANPEEYIRFFEILPDLLSVIDFDGKVVAVNPQWTQHTGYSRQELMNKPFVDLVRPEYIADIEMALELVLKGNYINNLEIGMKRKDDIPIWFSFKGVAVSDKKAVYMVGRDISDRKRLEKKLNETQLRYLRLFNSSPDAIVIINPKTLENIEFNDMAISRFGYQASEFSAMKLTDYLETCDENNCFSLMSELSQKECIDYESNLRLKNGNQIAVYITFQIMKLSGESVVICTIRDISEIRKTEQALIESENRFRLIFESANEGIWILDTYYHSILINNTMPELLGYNREEFLKKDFFDLVHPECREKVQADMNQITENNKGILEMRFIRKDGRTLWANTSFTYFNDPATGNDEILLMISDNTRNKEAEEILNVKTELLEEYARTDSLTKMLNHNTILSKLESQVELVSRYPRPLSIMMMDLDFFKNINDQYGHQFGDEVLRTVAQAIRKSVRSIDEVGRYGGEEFLIIMPETDSKKARHVSQRLQKLFSELEWPDKPGFHLSFSAGLVEYQGESFEDFVRKADALLYRAKEEGRNQIIFG